MALVIGRDGAGDWAAMECDQRGCFGHLTLRPAGEGWTGYDLVCETFDQAESAGWRLAGSTYCPRHVQDRPGRPVRVGDGYAWARTAVQGVKGGPRPA